MSGNPPVPENKIDIGPCISINRANLGNFMRAFQTSAALFELLRRGGGPPTVGEFGGVFSLYRIIAARDAALNLYHFKCCLVAIKNQLPRSPVLSATVDARALRNALRQFNKYFKNCDNVRNAIAHAAEIFSSPEIMRRNEQKMPRSGHGFSIGAGWLTNAIYETTYSVGIEGDVFSVQVDNTSVGKLAHVIALVDLAFQGPSEPAALPPGN